VEFQLLGPLRVLRDGEEVDIGPRKQRALLAVLLLSPGRVVTTDGLLDALWGDDAIGKENALWVYISRLRGLLEPERDAKESDSILETHDHGYSLRLDGHDLDTVRFDELIGDGTRLVRDDPSTAVGVLQEAGVHETAATLSDELGVQLWSIGVDVDEWLGAPTSAREHLLTSALKRHDAAVTEMVGAFANGTLEPGTFQLDLANGGVGYATSGDHLAASTIDRLEMLRLDIVNNAIDVPSFTNETAVIHPEENALITVSFDGNDCEVSRPELHVGDILRVEITNQTAHLMAFGLSQYLRDADFDDLLTLSDVQPGLTKTVFAAVSHDLDISAICSDDLGTWVSHTLELSAFTEADRVLAITFDGETCTADLDFEARDGEVIRYLMWNGSSDVAWFGVTRMVEGTTLEQLQELEPEDLPVLDPPDVLEFDVPPNEVATVHARIGFEGQRFVGCWSDGKWSLAGTFEVTAS